MVFENLRVKHKSSVKQISIIMISQGFLQVKRLLKKYKIITKRLKYIHLCDKIRGIYELGEEMTYRG